MRYDVVYNIVCKTDSECNDLMQRLLFEGFNAERYGMHITAKAIGILPETYVRLSRAIEATDYSDHELEVKQSDSDSL